MLIYTQCYREVYSIITAGNEYCKTILYFYYRFRCYLQEFLCFCLHYTSVCHYYYANTNSTCVYIKRDLFIRAVTRHQLSYIIAKQNYRREDWGQARHGTSRVLCVAWYRNCVYFYQIKMSILWKRVLRGLFTYIYIVFITQVSIQHSNIGLKSFLIGCCAVGV